MVLDTPRRSRCVRRAATSHSNYGNPFDRADTPFPVSAPAGRERRGQLAGLTQISDGLPTTSPCRSRVSLSR